MKNINYLDRGALKEITPPKLPLTTPNSRMDDVLGILYLPLQKEDFNKNIHMLFTQISSSGVGPSHIRSTKLYFQDYLDKFGSKRRCSLHHGKSVWV